MGKEDLIKGLEAYRRMLLEDADDVNEQIWGLRLGRIDPEDVDLNHRS